MKIFRWLLAAPAGIAGWYAVFIAGMFSYQVIERRACPQGQLISGLCGDPTVLRILNGVEVFFIPLSAVAVVTATAVVAPSRRDVVAWAAFAAGSLIAVYFAMETDMYLAGAAAIGAGLVAALLIARSRGPAQGLYRRDPPPQVVAGKRAD